MPQLETVGIDWCAVHCGVRSEDQAYCDMDVDGGCLFQPLYIDRTDKPAPLGPRQIGCA